jgi:protein gp37
MLTKRPNIGARLLAEQWDRIPSNIWVGTTIENQEWADRRLPHLLSIEAAVRFVSVEPQLGPLALRQHLGQGRGKINWVISGGESGAGARGWADMLTWYRSLRDQCAEANVPFFFKQWGRFMQGEGDTLYKLRGKNPDNLLDGLRWEQYPDEIRKPTPGVRRRVPSRLDRLLEDRFEYLTE